MNVFGAIDGGLKHSFARTEFRINGGADPWSADGPLAGLLYWQALDAPGKRRVRGIRADHSIGIRIRTSVFRRRERPAGYTSA